MRSLFLGLSFILWHHVDCSPAFPPLEGATRCLWSSAGQAYLYAHFYLHWGSKEAAFGWVAPLNCTFESDNSLLHKLDYDKEKACEEAEDAYAKDFNWVHAYNTLTKWPDLNHTIQGILPANLEVGFGAYLLPEYVDITTDPDGTWTVRNLLGSRVSSSVHTTCCFEFISGFGNRGGLVHTEYCIQKDFDSSEAQSKRAFWYDNRSHAEMNEETRYNCLSLRGDVEFSRRWLRANMPDNRSAFDLWTRFSEEGRDGFGRPWTEIYTGYADGHFANRDDVTATMLYM